MKLRLQLCHSIKLLSVVIFLFTSITITKAQTVLTLQPSAAAGKDATLSNFPNESTLNFGNNAEFISESSSINFNSAPKRSLIQFDLSSIPANATVISAYLSLYAYNPGTGGHIVLNNNMAYLFRVTQPWNEGTVTWSTQPTYSTADTVILSISDSVNQNYLNIDIRNQVQNWVTTPAGNNGFLFKQKYECNCSGRMIFASSDNPNSSLRPKLVVTYAVCSGPPPAATITPSGSPTICFGTNQTLTANAGTGFTYQWFKNGTFFTGGSSNTLLVSSTGVYTVKVTNPQGCTAISAATNLTVSLDNAQILTSLGSNTQGCANGGLTMNATAGGVGNTFQWYRNGGFLPSATSASYTSSIPGNYTCRMTNSTGTCTLLSNTIQSIEQVVTMNVTGSNYFCTNGNFSMTVQSVNIGTFRTFQWQQNGVDISGATNFAYAPTTSGTYQCIIDDAMCAGNTISPSNDVFAGVPPLMQIESSNGTNPSNLCGGQSVDLWLEDAITGEDYIFGGAQWYRLGGGSLPPNGGIPFLGNVVQSGVYFATLTTSCGTSTTPYYYVHSTNSGTTPPPIYPSNPITTCSSFPLSYQEHANDPWPSYQWQKNNADIPGATLPDYTVTSTGNYRLVFGNGCGTIASANTSITIGPPPAVITPQGSTTFCAGNSVLLKANTGGGYSYVWKKYGNVISGATSANYLATSAGVYKVIVTAPGGCSNASTNVTVTVNALPTAAITASGSTAICPGSSVSLNANTGTGLTYQWRKYSNDIVGATNSTYAATGAGQYKARVTNANGCSKNSNTITVTTLPAPTATITAIGPATFCQGDSVRLAANTGAGLSYQWKKGSNNISGANTANYYAKVAGNFKVSVTGSNGCVKNSNVIAVSVPCRTANSEQETPYLGNVSLYPNPSNGTFTLELAEIPDSRVEAKVFNILGEIKDAFIVSSKLTSYSNRELPPGIYLLTIYHGEISENHKFIISK